MKKILSGFIALFVLTSLAQAQAPSEAEDVMLQGFYWDSYNGGDYDKTDWIDLYTQADELSATFDMIWLPPSAQSEGGVGYHPTQWCNQNSEWGSASTLKTLISKLKEGDCRAIADIVVNHRGGKTGWMNFYSEDFGTYGSFNFGDSDICKDDEAAANGYSPSGPSDDGYEYLNCNGMSSNGAYCAARDLAHNSTNVQNAIKAYLQWMKNEMGFDGWRYDVAKGFAAYHISDYNNAAGAYYSVSEYWDRNADNLMSWVSDASNNSTTFDWAFKYSAMNDGLEAGNYGSMVWNGAPAGICGYSGRYATTFIDNHDTFGRDDSYNQFDGDWNQANAVMLAAPGIPCVFWPHWNECKDDIKSMIAARKACRIHSESACSASSTGSYYRSEATGKAGKLVCYVGSNLPSSESGYTTACSGNGWIYFTNVSVPQGPTLTVSPQGDYVGPNGQVTMSTTGGSIYYTTDGSTPSASSTQYTGAITITVDGTVVKAIAIDGTESSAIASYTFLTEEPEGITVEFKAPSSWTEVSLYAWTGDGESAVKLLGEWPGTSISKVGDYYTYTITNATITPINVIFNNGNNGKQTSNLSTSADKCWDGSEVADLAEITPAECGAGPIDPFSATVKFKAPAGWTKCVIWSWPNNVSTGAWPGDAEMTVDPEGFYTYTFRDLTAATNFLINNGEASGTEQTVDNETNVDVCLQTTGSTDSEGKYEVEVANGCVFVSIDEAQDNINLNIYPNPTTGKIKILAGTEVISITVSDFNAKTVAKAEGSSIDLSGLSSAMYFVEVQLADGTTAVRKVIKK